MGEIMSLNVDYRDVINRDERLDQIIPIQAMCVGITNITEDNWVEFFYRVHIWEHASGIFWRDENGDPVYTTPDDIHRYVGLKTNVSTRTKAQFKQLVWANLLEDAKKARKEFAYASGELDEMGG
jgi:hypothetical protein